MPGILISFNIRADLFFRHRYGNPFDKWQLEIGRNRFGGRSCQDKASPERVFDKKSQAVEDEPTTRGSRQEKQTAADGPHHPALGVTTFGFSLLNRHVSEQHALVCRYL